MRRPQLRRISGRGWSAYDNELATIGATQEEALQHFRELARQVDRPTSEHPDPKEGKPGRVSERVSDKETTRSGDTD